MKNTKKGFIGIVVIFIIIFIVAGGGVYMYFAEKMVSGTKYSPQDQHTVVTTSSDVSVLGVAQNENVTAPDVSTSTLKTTNVNGTQYTSKLILPPLVCVHNVCTDAYITVLRPIIPLITKNFFTNTAEAIYSLNIDKDTVKKLILYMVSLREEVAHPGDGSIRNDVDHFDPALPVRMVLIDIDSLNPNFNTAEELIAVYNVTTSELGKKRIMQVLEYLISDTSTDVMFGLLKSTSDQNLFKSALRNIVYVITNKNLIKDTKYSPSYGTAYITSELFRILEEDQKSTSGFKSTYILQVLSEETDIVNMIPNSDELITIASGKAGDLSVNSRLLAIYILALNHMAKVGVKETFTELESDSNIQIAAYAKDARKKPAYLQ